MENDDLQKEHDRLIDNQTKSINEARKREQDLRKQVIVEIKIIIFYRFSFQHKIEIDKIVDENAQQINRIHDLLKDIKLQNETLSTTFRVKHEDKLYSKINIIEFFRNKLLLWNLINNVHYQSYKINWKHLEKK